MSFDGPIRINPEKRKKSKLERATDGMILGSIVFAGTQIGGDIHDRFSKKELNKQYEILLQDKRLALPMLAMLARGYIARPVDLVADPALRHIRSIDPADVAPLVTRVADASFGEQFTHERTYQDALPETQTDERDKMWATGKRQTLQDQKQIFAEAVALYKKDPIQMGMSVAMVSRNLSWNQYPLNHTFKKDEVDPANPRNDINPSFVSLEVSAIQQERKRLHDMKPFSESDIILVSNNERTKNGNAKRFAKEAFVERLQQVVAESTLKEVGTSSASLDFRNLKAPAPYTLEHFTTSVDASVKELQTVKASALRAIEKSTRKTTFVFDGHGSETGIYLSNGGVEGTTFGDGVHITAKEMAQALSVRWFNQKRADPKATTLNISLVLASCFSQNFIRAVASHLESQGVPLPNIMMSTSEYGQYGFSESRNEYGTQFLTWTMRNPTIGSLIQNKDAVKDQTPTILVPRPGKPTKLMQLGGVVIPQSNSAAA